MQQVALAEDPDQLICQIHDRNAADAPFGKERRDRLHRCVRIDGNHIRGHHVHSAHRMILPDVLLRSFFFTIFDPH
jgi:hypothetical protein